MTAEPAIERTEVPEGSPVADLVHHAAEGHVVLVQVKGGPLARVVAIDPEQAWFWTPEWQAGEAEVDAERAAGKQGPVFQSGEEFLAYLEALDEEEPDTAGRT